MTRAPLELTLQHVASKAITARATLEFTLQRVASKAIEITCYDYDLKIRKLLTTLGDAKHAEA